MPGIVGYSWHFLSMAKVKIGSPCATASCPKVYLDCMEVSHPQVYLDSMEVSLQQQNSASLKGTGREDSNSLLTG